MATLEAGLKAVVFFVVLFADGVKGVFCVTLLPVTVVVVGFVWEIGLLITPPTRPPESVERTANDAVVDLTADDGGENNGVDFEFGRETGVEEEELKGVKKQSWTSTPASFSSLALMITLFACLSHHHSHPCVCCKWGKCFVCVSHPEG